MTLALADTGFPYSRITPCDKRNQFHIMLAVGNDDQVLAWGLHKHECQSLEALLIGVLRFRTRIGL